MKSQSPAQTPSRVSADEFRRPDDSLPPLASVLLALAAVLCAVLLCQRIRNVSVRVSDAAKLKSAMATIEKLEAKASEAQNLRTKAAEILRLQTQLLATRKEEEESRGQVAMLNQSLDKAVRSLRAQARGKKKQKQAEVEIRKLQAESGRQIASLRERQAQLGKEWQKAQDLLAERLKGLASAEVAPPPARLPAKGVEP